MPDNPYMVGGAGASGPSYAAPLMDWQGMAGGIANAFQRPQQPGQAAGPMNIRPPAQMPPQGGQQPFQGWGQRLQQWLQQRQQPGMASPGGPGGQFGGPQPMVPTAPGPQGLY